MWDDMLGVPLVYVILLQLGSILLYAILTLFLNWFLSRTPLVSNDSIPNIDTEH